MVSLAKILPVIVMLSIFSITSVTGAPPIVEASKSPELRWRKVTIPVAFSNSLLRSNPAIRPDSDVQGAIRRSLDAWEEVANIEFVVTWTDKMSVSPAGNVGDGTSLITIAQTPENLLVFGGESDEISARTRVFFNRRGEISEADIVLNPYQQFSTDGALGTFDFESTLTHEIGHLLGLEHATIVGSTMNEHQGKNGTFNLPSFSARTLSVDDVTQIRAIYGARDESDCCGTLDARISTANGKSLKGFNAWLEEIETGRVAVGVKINPDGSFLLRGLQANKYRVYMQDPAGGFAGQDLGEVEISKGKISSLTKKITLAAKDFDVQFTGFNGQLSKLAVPVNGGKSYQIYVGGKNLNPEDFKIGTNSPYFTVSSGTLTRLDYGKDISVFSFEIKSLTDTPIGDYTIYLQKTDGKIQYLPGAVSVERFLNSWSTLSFD